MREAIKKIRILKNKYAEVSEKAGLPTRAERMRTYVGRKAVNEHAKKQLEEVVKKRKEAYNKKQEELRKHIRSNAVNKKINKGAQNKHIPAAKGYIEGRSFILGDLDEAQKLVNIYSGTGEIKLTAKGEWAHKEFVVADHTIGLVVDPETGDAISTKRFAIHYGKKGTHIVPAREVKQ